MSSLPVAAAGAYRQPVHEALPDHAAAIRALERSVPRRISRFIQLALAGAYTCVTPSAAPLDAACAVYLASALGNTGDTLHLLQQVLELHEEPEPYRFINVSTNMAGFYLAQALGLHGANLTVSRRDFSFEAALELAALDLSGGAVPMALVGLVDQWSPPAQPAAPALPASPALDVSCWLMLDPACAAPLGAIEWVRRASGLREATGWHADAAGRPLQLQLGTGIGVDEAGALAAAFPGAKPLAAPEPSGTHGQAAWHVTHFLQARQGGTLLHIDGDGQGRYCGVLARSG